MIEDIAYTMDRIVSLNFLNITEKNPWIITGQSYSAMIAIWFKALYPDLAVGVYASSPILPTLLTPKISQKLYSNTISGGKKCRTVMESLMKQLISNVYGNKKEGFLVEMGEGVPLTSEDALFLFMDRVRALNRKTFVSWCSSADE